MTAQAEGSALTRCHFKAYASPVILIPLDGCSGKVGSRYGALQREARECVNVRCRSLLSISFSTELLPCVLVFTHQKPGFLAHRLAGSCYSNHLRVIYSAVSRPLYIERHRRRMPFAGHWPLAGAVARAFEMSHLIPSRLRHVCPYAYSSIAFSRQKVLSPVDPTPNGRRLRARLNTPHYSFARTRKPCLKGEQCAVTPKLIGRAGWHLGAAEKYCSMFCATSRCACLRASFAGQILLYIAGWGEYSRFGISLKLCLFRLT